MAVATEAGVVEDVVRRLQNLGLVVRKVDRGTADNPDITIEVIIPELR